MTGKSLKIITLGGLQIRCGGRPVKNTGSHRVEALLVYLAYTRQPQPREILADMMWADRPQRRAMANLRTVLTGLRQHFDPFVSITRDTVALNPNQTIWLDAVELLKQEIPVSSATVSPVQQAVELYRGDFLDGFHLRGALGFDDWLTIERENLRQRILELLSALVEYHLNQGDYHAGIGYARRLLQLDPLLERAHQQLMHLLAYNDQRAAALAQYNTCCQILAEEFGVEPAAGTTALFEQIEAGTLQTPVPAPLPAAELPAFLHENNAPNLNKQPVFVARRQQLAQLETHLAAVLTGQHRVVFVVGEAGRGKTALLWEFARKSGEIHPDLLVAGGSCSAIGSFGDPYLPFCDILGMLSGDVETKWTTGQVTTKQARRLWNLLPCTIQALVDEGSDLINVLVPGTHLLKWAEANLPSNSGHLERLRKIVLDGQDTSGSLGQTQLFEQYTQVLRAISNQSPLLLLLDDLQWIDTGTANLLFHLARRLAGSRIFILAAYRPSEVNAGPPLLESEAQLSHILTPIINELKRDFGDIEINLEQISETEQRAFVDTLLDNEPNRLGETFRTALLHQTTGHPLFTTELLREMQQRGTLIRDEGRHWIEGPALDWKSLPVRVQAIFEQRLGRLAPELRDILAIASVEGEIFTAQVVARMRGLNEQQIHQQLSQELVRHHRLIREWGEVTVGSQQLARFRFGHILFQQYLYNCLSSPQQKLLHGQTAACLKELYADEVDKIAPQLAHHFGKAGQVAQAVPYHLQAGDRARLRYAHQEAIKQYRQALTILKAQGQSEQVARTLMKLGLTYHGALDFEQARKAYNESFALQQQPAYAPYDPVPTAPHPFRLVWYPPPTTMDPTQAADFQSNVIIGQLFSSLVEESRDMQVVPEAAVRWELKAQGCQYLFHLRNDARWNDGVAVTASDFEYASRRLLHPHNQSELSRLLYDVRGARAFHQGDLSDPELVGIRALDPLTLQVELERPTPYFLHLLANFFPVPQHVVEAQGDNWTESGNLVTNGPFQVASWQPEKSMVLKRSPGYAGTFTGNLQDVTIRFLPDWSTRLALYENDELDVINLYPCPPQDRDFIRQRYAADYVSVPELGTWYATFDVNRPPFNDRRVRRAFVMATDREALINLVWRGHAIPATGGFLPPEMPGHSPTIGLPYDPRQARQLIIEAGYQKGDDHYFPEIEALVPDTLIPKAEYLRTLWQNNLNVDIKWQVASWAEAEERLSNHPPHLSITGWGADYPDPDSFLRSDTIAYGTGWRRKAYSELVKTARRTFKQEKRFELYQQADKMLITEAPIMPLGYGQAGLLVKPWVKSYPTSALAIHYFFGKKIIIDPH